MTKVSHKPTVQSSAIAREQAQMTVAIRDLTFIMSELSSFLTETKIASSK